MIYGKVLQYNKKIKTKLIKIYNINLRKVLIISVILIVAIQIL